MIKLYNTLSRKIEPFKPLVDGKVNMYSCGPTVYDHAHIGNLSSYIYADTLRRILELGGMQVRQVMNYTDVDDKTVGKSTTAYPNLPPKEALRKLTDGYIEQFLNDIKLVSIDVDAIDFVRATDSIEDIKNLIIQLVSSGVAYISDDGVYFSIEAYKKSGKTYGQLLKISDSNTSQARIDNDEYDKESFHDFALWKKQKEGEPAWDFEIDGHNIKGRPGWHIECSAMSEKAFGLPFDIHTGGIDLIFPHHENEIAQSTGAKDNPVMANYFVHSSHLLVDGKKMAKSANNFYTLDDIINKGYDPSAFRLLVLQSHYRNESNFSWENLESAQNRLKRWKNIAELRWQEHIASDSKINSDDFKKALNSAIFKDLDTPSSLLVVEEWLEKTENLSLCKPCLENIFYEISSIFGIDILTATPDIDSRTLQLIKDRFKARESKDWTKSDELRDELAEQGIGIRDTDHGSIWYRI